MDENKIKSLHKEVLKNIEDSNLVSAFGNLENMLRESGLAKDSAEVSNLRQTYGYLLHYLVEGMNDSGRDGMYSTLVARVRALADKAMRESRIPADSGYYYAQVRFSRLREENLAILFGEYFKVTSELSLAEAADVNDSTLRKLREDLMERIFNNIFTSYDAPSEGAKIIEALDSPLCDESMTALCVSAVTLGLLTYYDRWKLVTLLDIYQKAPSEKICARILAGVVLVLERYAQRVKTDKEIMDRFSLWQDDIMTYRRLRETVRVIVGTRDTERVVSKMKEEVIPELIKIRPDIMGKMKEMRQDPDSASLEDNPEWAEMLEKSGLAKKMQELSEMQNSGADLMMVTFSNLKQFPFFNNASNWFVPFDSRHSALSLTPEMTSLINLLREAGGVICDSDLYSLALASAHMPEAQRNMMSGQMGAQLEQVREDMKSVTLKSTTPEFDREILKVVRDLYRFFKLFRGKSSFEDPFSTPLDFISLPVIGEMMSDSEVLRIIGEFYFERGYYADALPLLEFLGEDSENLDATLFEKIGFCYQRSGNYKAAREAYEKAGLFKAPGQWRLKKLAFVSLRLNDAEGAIGYYEAALAADPENMSLLMSAGNAYLLNDDPENALRHFYHAQYLAPDMEKVIRAVAWGNLLTGKFSKSAEAYAKLTDSNPVAADWLNTGHAAFLLGDYRKALESYRKSLQISPAEFEIAFRDDLPTLEKLGADRNALLLLRDAMRLEDGK